MVSTNLFQMSIMCQLQLLERGDDIRLKDNCLRIRDNASNLIAKMSMIKNRMFVLNIQNDIAKYLKMCYKDVFFYVIFLGE